MDVRERINNILYNMGFFIEQSEDANLIEYGMDSLRFIELIVNIEQEFGIIIPDEALIIDNISSLNGFTTYIESFVEKSNDGDLSQL